MVSRSIIETIVQILTLSIVFIVPLPISGDAMILQIRSSKRSKHSIFTNKSMVISAVYIAVIYFVIYEANFTGSFRTTCSAVDMLIDLCEG